MFLLFLLCRGAASMASGSSCSWPTGDPSRGRAGRLALPRLAVSRLGRSELVLWTKGALCRDSYCCAKKRRASVLTH